MRFPPRITTDAPPHRSPRGQVVVIFAGAMLLFVLLAATVIDISWYWTNNLRMQRAADAAALAGVVFLPNEVPRAVSAARDEAKKNGYEHGVNGVVVDVVKDDDNDRRLLVTITGDVDTYFARAVGIQSWPASRSSKADFILPVPMGSPVNYYGVFGKLRTPGGGTTHQETVPRLNVQTSWLPISATKGTNTWSGTGNAYVSDNSYATSSTANAQQAWGNLNVTLPSNATIDGIELEYEASRNGTGANCQIRFNLSWDNGATYTTGTGQKTTPALSTSDPAAPFPILGSNSDQWGRGTNWTAAHFSNTNFRVRATVIKTTCNAGTTVRIDRLRFRVQYDWVETIDVFVPDANVGGPGGEALAPQGFWGVMHGSGSEDINGDAYLPRYSTRTGGANAEFDSEKYYNYAVEMPVGTTNGKVWIYDPVFCAVAPDMGTGDRWFGGSTPIWSIFNLYNTEATLFTPGDDTFVAGSGNTFKTTDGLTNPALNGPAASGSLRDCTTSGGSTGGNAGGAYHNSWYLLKDGLTGGANGTVYRLHTTTTDAANPNGNLAANGQNSFGLFVEAGGSAVAPRVYGLGAMEQYSPLPANDFSEFYLAQIEDAHADKTMEIRLWDIGDTPGGSLPVDLQILQPTSGGWAPAAMTWTAKKGTTNAGAYNCNAITGSGTKIAATSGGTQYFQGCWLTINVAIPATYTAPQDGWWKIRYDVGGSGASGYDLTTWEVNLRGNPVHLVLP